MEGELSADPFERVEGVDLGCVGGGDQWFGVGEGGVWVGEAGEGEDVVWVPSSVFFVLVRFLFFFFGVSVLGTQLPRRGRKANEKSGSGW